MQRFITKAKPRYDETKVLVPTSRNGVEGVNITDYFGKLESLSFLPWKSR